MEDVQFEYFEVTRPEVQEFILSNSTLDLHSLVLKNKFILGVPVSIIATQISGRKKAQEKLPSFYGTDGIIYPQSVSLEQCSSEKAAVYKTSFLTDELPDLDSIIDLTGGFGVDSFFFSKMFRRVDYVETDAELVSITRMNHSKIRANQIRHHNTSAAVYLSQVASRVDAIFIDPSRRVNSQKVFRLRDCTPDVTGLQDLIFSHTDWLLIKGSPLLDISHCAKELKGLYKVGIVSVGNDCKELLLLCKKGFEGEPVIHAINFEREKTELLTFHPGEEKQIEVQYRPPKKYLYEPNVSILKSGAFKLLTQRFAITKLDPNSHLYTSEQIASEFPGRIFEIDSIVKSDSKMVKKMLPDAQANIIVRNYPSSVNELKKKLKINEGGTKYLIATSSIHNRYLILATRIK